MMKNETLPNLESVNNSSSSRLPVYYIALASLISFVAVFGNGIVIYLIYARRRLHVETNYFVASLAAADFLVGLFLPTFIIACSTFWSDCDITTYFMFFNLFTLTSIANLFVMTVDRYISIVFPLRYQSYATSKRLFGSIIASWIIPAFLSFSLLFWKFSRSEIVKDTATKVHAFIVITAFEVIPTVALTAMYAHIFKTARRHVRQVAAHQTQLEFNSQVFNEESSSQMTAATGKRVPGPSKQGKGGRKTTDSSSVVVLGAVIGLFVLCWSFDAVISFCNKLELCIISDGLFRVSDLMIFLNSAINPLVYALFKKDIKRELIVICCCIAKVDIS